HASPARPVWAGRSGYQVGQGWARDADQAARASRRPPSAAARAGWPHASAEAAVPAPIWSAAAIARDGAVMGQDRMGPGQRGAGLRSGVIAGGGTGGHIEPAMALADALRRIDPEVRITCLGTERGLETKVIPARGYALDLIPAVPFPRSLTPALLQVPGKMAGAVRAAVDEHVRLGAVEPGDRGPAPPPRPAHRPAT